MVEKINQSRIHRAEPQRVEPKKVREGGFDKQFEECLSQALDGAPGCGSAPAGIGPLSLPGIQEIGLDRTPPELVPMERTLDLMERLTRALDDPRETPESFTPLIRDLDRQARDLMAGADRLPEGDGARSLLEQTAATAMVQVTKFERGDFI